MVRADTVDCAPSVPHSRYVPKPSAGREYRSVDRVGIAVAEESVIGLV